MKREEILVAFTAFMFIIVGATMKTQCRFSAMPPRDAEGLLGGQSVNCYAMVTTTCPGQSGDCSNTTACQNNMCLTGPEIDPSQPSYQDASPALSGWTQTMQAEGLYCQLLYQCNCKLNNNGVNACNKVQPGTYDTYRQPYTVTGDSCKPKGS